AHVLYAQLLQLDDVVATPASSIVCIALGRFSKHRDVVLHGPHGEFRIDQLALVLGHRRQKEAASQAADSPVQSELDGFADLPSNDGVDLRDLQAHDLVRRYPASLDPVADLR